MHRLCQKLVHVSRISSARYLTDYGGKDLNDVVIASAVRTPITGFNGNYPALPVAKLGAVAIDAALKHAAVPPESVQQVYFGNVLAAGVGQAPARQATLLAGLSKRVCCTTVSASSVTGMKTIMFAAQAVRLRLTDAAIAGGMESLSNVPYYMPRTHLHLGDFTMQDGLVSDGIPEEFKNKFPKTPGVTKEDFINYAKESYMRMRKASRAGLFDLELVPLRIMQHSRIPVMVTEDEERPLLSIMDELTNYNEHISPMMGDGASALVLTTNERAMEWNIKPLARIIAYNESKTDDSDVLTAPTLAIKRLLHHTNYTVNDVSLWELDDSISAVPLAVIKELELNPEKVNAHGGAVSLGNPIAMSGARLVTHLAHALDPGQIGCAAVTNESGNASALLIEKISYNEEGVKNKIPHLTLYTKDNCALCDELLNELEIYFDGQYTIEKVDITKKENVRFLRLYRNDIPVLFFNGQFLCMHKLNVNLLGRKMEELRMKNTDGTNIQ
ncbi:acetyl-CoA acetyltransferase, mitochondrial [Bactrocera dorsalis]|uniref:Acetyl-CoA acetyltransferase, mitochondrial n=1 Tax=Bactrocera dorsalis TaxID=27457 RepID=A0A6I9UVU4_BACDO|nr:acetyl-CoA acetyltransferase, mitochondrial [Bactrocera dorsalis]